MKVKDAVKKSMKKAETPVDAALKKVVNLQYTAYILAGVVVVIAVAFAWCALT